MPFSVTALITAFVSGIVARQLVTHTPGCICDCSPREDAFDVHQPLIELLRGQLERCGPENLHREPPLESLDREPPLVRPRRAPRERAATGSLEIFAGGSLAWVLLNLILVVFGVLLVIASRRRPAPLALTNAPAEHVPRWIPPSGSRAREL